MLRKQKRITSNRLIKNNKGVTLVELIAVIAVLSVVSAAVAGFMITGSKMSAKVSGAAGDSMKEQTTVEFINKAILKNDSESLILRDELKKDDGQGTGTYAELIIKLNDADTIRGLVTTDENNKVIYKTLTKGSEPDQWIDSDRAPIELCPGKITFEKQGDTLTYKLDDEEHVVHLRVAPKS